MTPVVVGPLVVAQEQRATIVGIPEQTLIKASNFKYAESRLNLVGLEHLLGISQTFLGVSGYQLARLVGRAWPSISLNQWRNGRAGMGTLSMGRLLYLWWLKVQGYDVFRKGEGKPPKLLEDSVDHSPCCGILVANFGLGI